MIEDDDDSEESEEEAKNVNIGALVDNDAEIVDDNWQPNMLEAAMTSKWS